MPLNYLSGGPEDVYALNRLGSSFSDMVIGLQLNRQRQQQFMAQQALEQARVQMEREKLGLQRRTTEADIGRITAETGKIGAESDYYRAKGATERETSARERDLSAGAQVAGRDIETLGTVDLPPDSQLAKALQASIAKRVFQIAATNPSNITRQTAESEGLTDPFLRRLIATQTPGIMSAAPGANLVNVMDPQPHSIFQSPPRIAYQDPRVLNARIAGELGRAAGSLRKGALGDPEDPEYLRTMGVYNRALGNIYGDAGAGSASVPEGASGGAQRKIRVRSKDGTPGYIPEDQLDAALKEGYTRIAE